MSAVATVPYGITTSRSLNAYSRNSISSDQSVETPDQYFGSPNEIDAGEFFLFDEIYKPRPTPLPLDPEKSSQHAGPPLSPRVPTGGVFMPYHNTMPPLQTTHNQPPIIHDFDFLGSSHQHLAHSRHPSFAAGGSLSAPDVCNQTFQDLSELIRQEQEKEVETSLQTSLTSLSDSIVPDVESLPLTKSRNLTPSSSYHSTAPRKRTASEISCKSVEEQPLVKLFKEEIVVHDDPFMPSTSYSKCSDIRERNNQASRRSRMTRKEKEREMEMKAAQLESDNRELHTRVRNLEELVNRLKKHLMEAISKKN